MVIPCIRAEMSILTQSIRTKSYHLPVGTVMLHEVGPEGISKLIDGRWQDTGIVHGAADVVIAHEVCHGYFPQSGEVSARTG